MKWRPLVSARGMIWLFVLLLLADSAVAGVNIYRTAINENRVTDTIRTLNALFRLKIDVMDAERGIRDFVITGDDRHLSNYRTALSLSESIQNELLELTKDSPEQTQRLLELRPVIQRRFDLLSQRLDTLRIEPAGGASDRKYVVAGFETMTEIIHRINAMTAVEEKTLNTRRQSAQNAIATSIATVMIGGGLTIAMLIVTHLVIQREITTRRRSEELHQQNEERFRAIAESLPQIVWVARPDGSHQYYNKRWFNFTGLTPDESGGFGWIHAIHAEDQPALTNIWRKAIVVGQPFECEFRIRHQSGAFRWHLSRAIPLCDKRGQVIRWFGTHTDIDDRKRAREELEDKVRERTAELRRAIADLNREATERERATEELRLSAAELVRSNRELEQFAYVASHDLQEPLRKIQAFGDRLGSKYGSTLDEQGRSYLDRMLDSAARMHRLINDLLTYSRVSTKAHTFETVDLNDVVREVLSDLEERINETQAHVIVEGLPAIQADRTQMRQLFQNLIANALKFHKPQTIPEVTIRARDVAEDLDADLVARPAITIEVIDNGIGFDLEYSNRIFQLFQRLHARGEYQGTGIGLAVVRKIVERHGGTVSASSTPGEGAKFTVVLPVGHSTVGQPSKPAAADSVVAV